MSNKQGLDAVTAVMRAAVGPHHLRQLHCIAEYTRSVGLEKRPRTTPGNASNNQSSGTARLILSIDLHRLLYKFCFLIAHECIIITLFSSFTPRRVFLEDCPDISEDSHNAIYFESLYCEM